MSVVNPTITNNGDGSLKKFVFAAMANGDTGAPIPFAEWADRSVQVSGTFGVGGTVVWEGSNDGGATWATLTDPQGNSISKTAASIEAVLEITELARPNVTAGDGSTAINVSVLCRRQNNMRA